MVFDKVGQFFSRNSFLPSCDSYIIAGCERDVEEAKEQPYSDEALQACLMRLLWALIHSKHPQHVKRGIEMLQLSLAWVEGPLMQRDRIYLLAVGYYKSGNRLKSMDHVKKCLQITPDWRQALTLEMVLNGTNNTDFIRFTFAAFSVASSIAHILRILRKE